MCLNLIRSTGSALESIVFHQYLVHVIITTAGFEIILSIMIVTRNMIPIIICKLCRSYDLPC